MPKDALQLTCESDHCCRPVKKQCSFKCRFIAVLM